MPTRQRKEHDTYIMGRGGIWKGYKEDKDAAWILQGPSAFTSMDLDSRGTKTMRWKLQAGWKESWNPRHVHSLYWRQLWKVTDFQGHLLCQYKMATVEEKRWYTYLGRKTAENFIKGISLDRCLVWREFKILPWCHWATENSWYGSAMVHHSKWQGDPVWKTVKQKDTRFRWSEFNKRTPRNHLIPIPDTILERKLRETIWRRKMVWKRV